MYSFLSYMIVQQIISWPQVDGTILYAAKDFNNEIPPIISFSMGTLGFMCRFLVEDMQSVVEKVVAYHRGNIPMPFLAPKMMRLESKIQNYNRQDNTPVIKVFLNEVYIFKKDTQRVQLEIWVNDQYLTSTTCSGGIIISTPTGSTALSLMVGGPILQNGVNGILVIPIAPNSLSFRPIIFPSDSIIKVRLHKQSRGTAIVSFDGQITEEFGFDNEMTIKRSQHDIIFFEQRKDEAKMPTWIQRLKYFLGWNEKYKAPSAIRLHVSHQASDDNIILLKTGSQQYF